MRPRAAEEFSAFVLARSAALFRTAYLLTGDHRRAADLVRHALVEVYLHWPRVSAMEQPDGFARRVLVTEVASSWHRRSSAEPAVTLRESTEAAPESRAVWDAVLTLPPRQRAVLVLRYYEDLTDAETARVLGIAAGSVQSHARAANLRLAGLLAGAGGALGQERAT
jgi:RNA polymerase sigma-70 factor (sigma-E family)